MIRKFLDLGLQPLANKYLTKKDLVKKKVEYYYHLEIGFNTTSKLVSILNTVPSKKMFDKEYPYRASMSHTMINSFNTGKWRVFGETLDLTIGQLIDQIGRYAGFSSPAGAIMEELARKSKNYLMLPYSVKGNDVSFSGILTSAKKLLDNDNKIEDVSYSLQETAYSMLTEVTERALAFLEKEEVLISGGVAASSRLKEMLDSMCKERGATLNVVPKKYAGDCGAQIAWTGILSYKTGIEISVSDSWVKQSWRLDRVKIKWRK